MSFYFLTFLLLAAGTLAEWYRPRYGDRIYGVCFAVATVCLCFRFGQGTDYVAMHGIYNTIPAVIDLSQGYICGFFPEVGWRLVCALFKLFGAPFWVFTMALGLVDMLLVHRFLKKYVPMRTAGLFLLYPVLYVVYMVSGLRQGLAMCIFLGVLIPFYLEKKWAFYVAGVLIAGCFHRVAYVWLVLPIACYLPMGAMLALTALAAAAGLVLQIPAVEGLIVSLVPIYHVEQFLLDGSLSIFALGERVLSFGAIFLLYLWFRKKDGQVDRRTELFLKAYMCGVCFYLLLCGNAYYASRYASVFKVLECAVLASLLTGGETGACGATELSGKRERMVCAVAAFFFVLTLVMGYKNLNAMISEGEYDPALRVFNFPYVSVFNQEAIERHIPYGQLLDAYYEFNIEDQQLWMIEE